jgi:hypothetical protein
MLSKRVGIRVSESLPRPAEPCNEIDLRLRIKLVVCSSPPRLNHFLSLSRTDLKIGGFTCFEATRKF